VQALVARAMMQRVAICGRCMSINRHVLVFKSYVNSIVSVY
jgi:hypothetical protein